MTLRSFPSLAILLVVTAAIAGCRIFGSYPCGADSDCPADLALCREARCTAPPIADSPSAEGEGEPEGPAEGEGEGENQGEGEGEDPAEGEGENQGEGEGEDPAEGEGEGENPGEGEGEGEGEGGLRPCERIVDIVPADGFAIDAGITVHFEMPLFDVIAGGRHNLQLWDGMVSLPRFIDPAVVDRLYVTTRLPAVPGDGLQLLASACNNAEPENDERSVVDYVFRAGDMAVDEAVCPVPTTTAEECGISRPDLAFIYLNAVGSCRVVPANGFSIVWTQPLELTDGRYLVEYDWSMAGVLYDFCEGNTSGSAFVEVGDTRFGTHSVSIPGFGRGCVGSEARPTNRTAARIVGTFGLFAGSPLRIGLTAGDCANVELGIRNLRIERTVVPLPTITVRP